MEPLRRAYAPADEEGCLGYDAELAERIRAWLGDRPDLSERRMFGGLAFLVDGHMAVAASGQGGLMVRVDPDDTDELTAAPGVRPMEMRGRPMRGWLLVDDDALRTPESFGSWLERSLAFVSSLPPKR